MCHNAPSCDPKKKKELTFTFRSVQFKRRVNVMLSSPHHDTNGLAVLNGGIAFIAVNLGEGLAVGHGCSNAEEGPYRTY
jgi:hypothetical protein